MERDLRLDLCRGMLMFGVIWGHAITVLLNGYPNVIGIHPIFRTYDMPLFMILSGYFLALAINRKTKVQMLKDKITTILIPTILWSLIASRGKSIFNYYFCYSVFLSSVLVILGNCMNKNFKVLFLCGIAMLLQIVPFKFNMSYLYPFFLLGYFFKSNLMDKVIHGGAKYIMFFVFCLCFWKSDFTIWSTGESITHLNIQNIIIVLFRFFIGFIGSVAFMCIVNIVYSKYKESNSSLFKIFINGGKESLALYILQHIALFGVTSKIVIKMVQYVHFNPFTSNELLLGYIIAPIYSLFLMYCMLTFIQFVKKYKYIKWMFGFKIK